MTAKEAFRAIGEIINTSKDKDQIQHLTDLSEKIILQEVPETAVNEYLDEQWWDSTHQED